MPPGTLERKHIPSMACWCNPVVDYYGSRIRGGGKPSKQTPADKRLKENRPQPTRQQPSYPPRRGNGARPAPSRR